MPNIFTGTGGGYAEFLDHISLLRIKYLNSVHKFAQQLTVNELEEEVRDSVESTGTLPLHIFHEIASILEYCPAGFSVDDDGDENDDGVEESGDGDGEEPWIN